MCLKKYKMLIVLYVVNENTWFGYSCSYPRIYVTAGN